MIKSRIIDITLHNIQVYSDILEQDLIIGDRVIRLEEDNRVTYSKSYIERGSNINPVDIAIINLEFGEVFRRLVDL